MSHPHHVTLTRPLLNGDEAGTAALPRRRRQNILEYTVTTALRSIAERHSMLHCKTLHGRR